MNGGGTFLIPYFIIFFSVSIPVFYFETAIGQVKFINNKKDVLKRTNYNILKFSHEIQRLRIISHTISIQHERVLQPDTRIQPLLSFLIFYEPLAMGTPRRVN